MIQLILFVIFSPFLVTLTAIIFGLCVVESYLERPTEHYEPQTKRPDHGRVRMGKASPAVRSTEVLERGTDGGA